MAITALTLARTHKRFTLTCFVEGQEMQIISLQATAAKEPTLTEPMSWARERKRDLDLFVIMTPELVNWKFLEVGKSLQNYRDTIKKPDARLAINALCHMSLHIGSPRCPGIFDMAGFGPHTIQIMNCIAAGKF
ncbi:hypothetical protein B566_EDAN014893 [Ephemera danica]|nr:hypothetical protein B566_EDAN014893 [Ephemera danica]